MKKLFAILVLGFCLVAPSCAQSSRSSDVQEDGKGKVVQMDNRLFLDQVFDYASGATEWKYKGKLPAIIDFYATWCGPCRTISPILKDLAEAYKDRIVVYKVDVDREKELAAAMGIRSLPTVVFIPVDGQPQVLVGAAGKEVFQKAVDTVLLGEKE